MISVEAISALVGSLQEAALGTAGWSPALEGFCSSPGCDAIGLTSATQHTHLKPSPRPRSRLGALDVANDRALAALEHVRDALALVTPARRVLFRNAAATEILSRRDSLILQGGRLSAARDAEALALRHLVERAAGQGSDIHRGGSLRITRLSGDRPVVVHVLPLREKLAAHEEAGVLVLMIDPDRPAEPDLALLREVFGLSAAEAVVASRIARGDNLKSIAENLSVSLTTVRTQLQNVFEKTDTHRQADLVRLLLRTGVV